MKPGFVIRITTAIGAVILTVPTLVIVIASFGAGKNIVFPPRDWTLARYVELASDPIMRQGFFNSLYVGVESVLIGLLVGVPAIIALHRHRLRLRAFLNAFLALGFAAPLIVSGIAFLVLFTSLGVVNFLSTVGVALAIINLPFMLWAGAASAAAHNPELEEAAETLGAEEIQRFLFVTLPSLAPGILTGAMLMFVFGITEFMVSLMLVNVHTLTLPVHIFGSIRQNMSPVLAASGVLYIVISAAVLGLIVRVGKIEQFLRRE